MAVRLAGTGDVMDLSVNLGEASTRRIGQLGGKRQFFPFQRAEYEFRKQSSGLSVNLGGKPIQVSVNLGEYRNSGIGQLGGKKAKTIGQLGGKQCIPIGQLGGETALNLVTDVYRAVLLLLLQQFFYSFQQIKRTTTQRRSG